MPYAPQSGRSSMVERELPKLYTRVRFPSPAPDLLINQQVMIYQLVTFPRVSRYNLNYPLFYARTGRVIGLWYKGAYQHAGGGSWFLPRQHNNEQKAAYLA